MGTGSITPAMKEAAYRALKAAGIDSADIAHDILFQALAASSGEVLSDIAAERAEPSGESSIVHGEHEAGRFVRFTNALHRYSTRNLRTIADSMDPSAALSSHEKAEHRCYECNGPLNGPYCPACQDASPQPAVDGWKLVPVELTEAMAKVLHDDVRIYVDCDASIASILNAQEWWEAILAASPTPEPSPPAQEASEPEADHG